MIRYKLMYTNVLIYMRHDSDGSLYVSGALMEIIEILVMMDTWPP